EPFDPGYAPTVVIKGEWLYLTASWDAGGIWRARDPLGPWERLGEYGQDADGNPCWLRDHEGQPVGWGDPCLFVDDDGTMYCYCNLMRPTRPEDHHPWKLCPADGKIYGVRLRDDIPYQFAAPPVELISFNPEHWWERFGEANQHYNKCHILEGAWMTKTHGRYYLQYSGNGTQWRNYALGCYRADAPLGPFTPQELNPILIQRGGLVNGTAHHSLVEGPDGRFWCFYTCRVNNVHPMERRIGMDPVRFDSQGEMYVEGPTETPQFAPGHNPQWNGSNDAGLLMLSVNCPVTASSVAPGRESRYAVDNSLNTWWQAAGEGPHWLEVDLLDEFNVSAARTIFADCGLNFQHGVLPGPYQYRLLGSLDRQTWEVCCDQSENTTDRQIAYDTWAPQRARYLRLEVLTVPPGMTTGIWEFTVFGHA
ncbi:MAG TPA: family 43 glycosylhydrolase, partial [Armatimonadota bacterium]